VESHLTDNTFLARWISGDLTPEEFEAFKKTKDYPIYKKINDASQTLDAPIYNKLELFEKIQHQNAIQELIAKPKVIKLIPNWAYGVAASIVLAFGVFYFMNSQTHFETDFSEQLAITLPDFSNVQLNANSQLDYKSRQWENNRELTLNGEAFFDVEKGTSFKVNTTEGTIEVIGTEFNITARDNYFEVQCFEGKVKVISSATNNEAILTQGKAFRIVNNNAEVWDFILDEPNWLQGESSFNKTPLSEVIISFENQFEVVFDISKININKRFTGSFTHSDLKLALKTVFAPMDISYAAMGKDTILLVNSNK